MMVDLKYFLSQDTIVRSFDQGESQSTRRGGNEAVGNSWVPFQQLWK